MKFQCRLLFIFSIWLLFGSCTIHDKEFDNPLDYEANEELGIDTPSLVFYPKTQTKTISDSVVVESFIIFKPDSIESFAGVHLQIEFPNSFLALDTINPGLLITDTSQATPLFAYSFDGTNIIDIYTYFLDTLKLDQEGTGHLADLIFNPTGPGNDSIRYHLDACEIIDHNDNAVEMKGDRSAEVIVQ